MKKLLLIILLFLPLVSMAQPSEVMLVVTGEGATKEEATNNALRSAVEQAFGVFVSANTAILNDDVVKDEIATVSSGNINRYEELSAFETNGIWGVTLNAVVSIDKLVDYVQSKGAETEFAGQTFAMQMKMRKLNKENEMQALLNLVDQVELLTCSYSLFDYELVQGEAEYVDGNKYRIPLKVYAIKNINYKNVQKLILDTFKSLAITAEEQSAYASNKYPTNNCKPLVVDGLDNSFCMRSDADFLKMIERKIRRHIKLNEHCFQVERVGSGKENRYFYVWYSMENIQADYSLSPEIPENVLYNTSGFKVAPNLSLRQESITAVDLGLSVKWGQMNIGCSPINPLGDYYSWGETEPKSNYDWSTYKYCNGSYYTLTKYCNDPSRGYNGFIDNKTVLDLSDDAAREKLGGSWRMPTDDEWKELRNNCTWTWTTQNGVNGYRVTSKTNGNSIFLPATGYRYDVRLGGVGSYGRYWSSTLDADLPNQAWYVRFDSSNSYRRCSDRCDGQSIRPVYGGIQIESVSLSNNSLSLAEKDTYPLVATIQPANAWNTSVNWSSNNPSVATVSSTGLVTAVSPGTATITVTTHDDGYTATCTVTVNEIVAPDMIDLGLSVKWGSFNLGAVSPEGYGGYYAWGETRAKSNYDWSTYKYCIGRETPLTKYCTDASYGYNCFTDNKTVLDLSDDAARVKLGGSWRMPTDEEWTELREQCTWTWTTQNGVNGYRVTSKTNGNSIFLPAAGYRDYAGLYNVGSYGVYWSSTLYTDDPSDAWYVYFYSSNIYRSNGYRYYGSSIRPVYGERERVVDLGLSVKWADRNLGANSPEEYGGYYSWGETEPKSNYVWSTYKYCNGDNDILTKYCSKSSFGYNGYTDSKTVLDLEDDAARANWGGSWRMPTDDEWKELINNCTWTWTTQNGVNGYRVTSKTNGNSIFLPAAGCRYYTDLHDDGSGGYYWSSTLYTGRPDLAWYVYFNSSHFCRGYDDRCMGPSIRPVLAN